MLKIYWCLFTKDGNKANITHRVNWSSVESAAKAITQQLKSSPFIRYNLTLKPWGNELYAFGINSQGDVDIILRAPNLPEAFQKAHQIYTTHAGSSPV